LLDKVEKVVAGLLALDEESCPDPQVAAAPVQDVIGMGQEGPAAEGALDPRRFDMIEKVPADLNIGTE